MMYEENRADVPVALQGTIRPTLSAEPNLKGDWSNFLLLILLYTMQGLPFGLAVTFPIIFQSRNIVSYHEQAFFSLVAWPYSVKILWAPIVDSLYIQRVGRRKSWLIPVQYLIGVSLFYTAANVDEWLPESGQPNVRDLVIAFCAVSFLAATQDIVVDGWALTMLKKNNVGHASTCNGTGLALGVIISAFCTVMLTSEDFCNRYLRFEHSAGGLITIKSYLYFLSIVFISVTTLIGIFKRDNDNGLEDDLPRVKINVIQNYKLLWDVLKLPSIRVLVLALITMKIGFAATDTVSKLKLIDVGVSKEDLMMITILMYVVKFLTSLVVSKYTSGPKPMSAYMNLMPVRLLWNVTYVALIYYTPTLLAKHDVEKNVSTYYYYSLLMFIKTIHEILSYTMFLFTIGFFSRISDSRFGGTYMTMLSTIASFGWAVSNTLALKMIDVLTFRKCTNDVQNDCSTSHLKDMCEKITGDCIIIVNGYYVEAAICTTFGFVWYFVYRNIIRKLQNNSSFNWSVDLNRINERESTTTSPMLT